MLGPSSFLADFLGIIVGIIWTPTLSIGFDSVPNSNFPNWPTLKKFYYDKLVNSDKVSGFNDKWTYQGHILLRVSNRFLLYPRLKFLRLSMCKLSYQCLRSRFHPFQWHTPRVQGIGTKIGYNYQIFWINYRHSQKYTLIWLQFTGCPWVKDFVVVVVCVVGAGPFPDGTSAQLM